MEGFDASVIYMFVSVCGEREREESERETHLAVSNWSFEKPSCAYILQDKLGVTGDNAIAIVRNASNIITRSCSNIKKNKVLAINNIENRKWLNLICMRSNKIPVIWNFPIVFR